MMQTACDPFFPEPEPSSPSFQPNSQFCQTMRAPKQSLCSGGFHFILIHPQLNNLLFLLLNYWKMATYRQLIAISLSTGQRQLRHRRPAPVKAPCCSRPSWPSRKIPMNGCSTSPPRLKKFLPYLKEMKPFKRVFAPH